MLTARRISSTGHLGSKNPVLTCHESGLCGNHLEERDSRTETRMPPKPPAPPLNAALTVLRNLLGWPQNELAAVLGCGPTLLSDYEAGRKPLSRERLDEIA